MSFDIIQITTRTNVRYKDSKYEKCFFSYITVGKKQQFITKKIGGKNNEEKHNYKIAYDKA